MRVSLLVLLFVGLLLITANKAVMMTPAQQQQPTNATPTTTEPVSWTTPFDDPSTTPSALYSGMFSDENVRV